MIAKKLQELGIVLPAATTPVFQYVPVTVHERMAFVSGQLPRQGESLVAGKLGADVDLERGREAARLCILHALACLNQALGSLDRVESVVKMLCMVNAVPDFKDHAKVANGMSDLFVEIFGDAGQHARSAVGMGSLPNQSSVEIEGIVSIKP